MGADAGSIAMDTLPCARLAELSGRCLESTPGGKPCGKLSAVNSDSLTAECGAVLPPAVEPCWDRSAFSALNRPYADPSVEAIVSRRKCF